MRTLLIVLALALAAPPATAQKTGVVDEALARALREILKGRDDLIQEVLPDEDLDELRDDAGDEPDEDDEQMEEGPQIRTRNLEDDDDDDDDDDSDDDVPVAATFGPVEFHVVPQVGVGLLLRDQPVIQDLSDGFTFFRLPGFIMPNANQTRTGITVELTSAPVGFPGGVAYSVISYTHTKVVGPSYAGVNVKLVTGAQELPADFSGRVTPVVGLRLFTFLRRIPLFFEVEFLDTNRPVKASIVLTWE